MSGITPILDTLLHQVLGKRADIAAQGGVRRDVPVTPANPGTQLRPVESDSRLHPRLDAPPGPDRGARSAPMGDVQNRSLLPQSDALSNSSAQRATGTASKTTLSQAAQWIEHLIRNSPRQWSPAVRVPGVLLESAAEAAPARQLAEKLGRSIRSSGLFYESHLGKWYTGKMPAAELAREPQMRLRLSGSAAAEAPKGSASSGFPGLSDAGAAARAPDGAAIDTSTVPGSRASAEAQERLQAIVRHQIELLSAPALKWEGEVTAGVPMFLEIPLPKPRDEGLTPDESDDGQAAAERSPEWSTQIELFFPQLGELRVSLSRSVAGLKLGLAAEAGAADLLRDDARTLLDRLGALGFESPQLGIVPLEDE